MISLVQPSSTTYFTNGENFIPYLSIPGLIRLVDSIPEPCSMATVLIAPRRRLRRLAP